VLRLALVLAVVTLVGCGGSDDESEPSPSPSAPVVDENGCVETPAPEPKAEQVPEPTAELDPATTYLAVVNTNCGQFEITLDVRRAPKTAASFVSLAERKFYDGLAIHRIVPGFVFQGGDPAGDGTGGPGYTIVERPPRDLVYRRGVVAMAKSATDPPGASGSQFFVVTGDARRLPPEYALVGWVPGGRDVVARVGSIVTDPRTEAPSSPVVIRSITIVER
jgi:peptidyl-prolyl cis-trans isomerase B (cyclophilin B)